MAEDENKMKEIIGKSGEFVKDAFEKTSNMVKDAFDKTSKTTKDLTEMAFDKMEEFKDANEFKKCIHSLGLFVYEKMKNQDQTKVSYEECKELIEEAKKVEIEKQ